MSRSIRIAPSILSADFARLGEEITAVIAAGADLIHFDVMDNHYVPNLTIGPLICEAIKPYAVRYDEKGVGKPVPIDVHLMVKPVDALIPMFVKAGASNISFHPEATEHVDRTIQLIKSLNATAGLVLNPATPLNVLDHVIDELDGVLVMSVNPGFGGQSFIESALPKIEKLRRLIDDAMLRTGREMWLEVDGGVKPDNAARIGAAGADTLVAGSAVFSGGPAGGRYADAIAAIRQAAAQGRD